VSALLLASGVLVVVLSASGVLFTLVLARTPAGFELVPLAVARGVHAAFCGLARLARTYEAKDGLLALGAPTAVAAGIAVWAGGFVLGFGLVITPHVHSLGAGVAQAAAALFTAGTLHAAGPRDLAPDVAAGASWAVIVALQIAYLPTLYSAFNRRETLVSLLESRAGLPAWGPELLVRHELVGITDTLAELYASWEAWAAEVAETHTTYPVLCFFRSPEPWYSWLGGLLAVLDAAAMQLALAPAGAPSTARLCLRMGFTALRRIGTMLAVPIDPDPSPEGPIRLAFEEFAAAVAMLESAGFPLERGAEAAWPDFVGWRVNYEDAAYRLGDLLLTPPSPWSGPRRQLPPTPVPPRRPPQRRPRSTPPPGRHPASPRDGAGPAAGPPATGA